MSLLDDSSSGGEPPPDRESVIAERMADAVRKELQKQSACHDAFGRFDLEQKLSMPTWHGFHFPLGGDDSEPPTALLVLFEVHGERAEGSAAVSFSGIEAEQMEMTAIEVLRDSGEVIWRWSPK